VEYLLNFPEWHSSQLGKVRARQTTSGSGKQAEQIPPGDASLEQLLQFLSA
jgi:hypothetical protein